MRVVKVAGGLEGWRLEVVVRVRREVREEGVVGGILFALVGSGDVVGRCGCGG